MATREIHDYTVAKSDLLWTLHEAACYLARVPILGRIQVTDVHSTALVKRIYDDLKKGKKLGRFKTYPPVLPENWIGAFSGEPRAIVEFAATRYEALGYAIPSEFQGWITPEPSVGAQRPIEPTHSRFDLLAGEIETAIAALGGSPTAAAVMQRLKAFAGCDGSCILKAVPEGVKWRDGKAKTKTLDVDNLRKRLERRTKRARQKAAPGR